MPIVYLDRIVYNANSLNRIEDNGNIILYGNMIKGSMNRIKDDANSRDGFVWQNEISRLVPCETENCSPRMRRGREKSKFFSRSSPQVQDIESRLTFIVISSSISALFKLFFVYYLKFKLTK